MEQVNRKKWQTILLTAVMSVSLVFTAAACGNGNGDNGNTIIVPDNNPDVIVPDTPDVDVDVDTPDTDSNDAPAE
ncbi:hypothetical protein [Paenibacillus sp. 1P07SE]|uniref:hypothetical protein n=1 Tax=Paenibacillus sp. 1P07SE TaxID=3132209 RepID=UPI0039A70822